MELPKELTPELTPTDDCGGLVVSVLSRFLTKMVVHGIGLNPTEQEVIYRAMSLANADNMSNRMDSRINKNYTLDPLDSSVDDAGQHIVKQMFSKVWFDTITRQQLVLIGFGKLASKDELWCYAAISHKSYMQGINNRDLVPPTLFPVIEFHSAQNADGSDRFQFTGKYIQPPGGPELA